MAHIPIDGNHVFNTESLHAYVDTLNTSKSWSSNVGLHSLQPLAQAC